MNTTWRKRSIAALALVTLTGAGAWGTLSAVADGTTPAPTPPTATATATADQTLVENLTYMREEERMARDLYRALADVHGADTEFARIANAEQQHFDAVGRLLVRYGIDDPSAGKDAGKYADADLQAAYDRLLAQGKSSLAEAYKAGIEVEQTDIADLDKVIAETTAADAKRVFENLRTGSQHHLAAFTALSEGKTPAIGQSMGMGMGAANGQGQQFGARSGDDTTPRGDGLGHGPGNGVGQGMGQGQGHMNRTDRPADCPNQ